MTCLPFRVRILIGIESIQITPGTLVVGRESGNNEQHDIVLIALRRASGVSGRFTPDEVSKPMEAGRIVEFILRGCRSPAEWRLTGVDPFAAASTADWFDPRQYGWKVD